MWIPFLCVPSMRQRTTFLHRFWHSWSSWSLDNTRVWYRRAVSASLLLPEFLLVTLYHPSNIIQAPGGTFFVIMCARKQSWKVLKDLAGMWFVQTPKALDPKSILQDLLSAAKSAALHGVNRDAGPNGGPRRVAPGEVFSSPRSGASEVRETGRLVSQGLVQVPGRA